jgi:hypothetical protein
MTERPVIYTITLRVFGRLETVRVTDITQWLPRINWPDTEWIYITTHKNVSE